MNRRTASKPHYVFVESPYGTTVIMYVAVVHGSGQCPGEHGCLVRRDMSHGYLINPPSLLFSCFPVCHNQSIRHASVLFRTLADICHHLMSNTHLRHAFVRSHLADVSQGETSAKQENDTPRKPLCYALPVQ